ncbi:MrcB family domain-containing protein [Brevundimonas aveniformis]|uniref:MrcB family domain-containing protein n=1 Tax=Brevundimonas aveniformis TaxID=370977 RepID=UPI0003F64D3C|nr:DUF3578 domain-containing protein [Brevundimonas aveniformis]
MSLELLTDPSAVNRALDEYDGMGGDAFLAKYGFARARDHFLARGGRLYDSKAIAGVAYGYQYPDQGPLKAAEFSGGEATVAKKLRELGFAMFGDQASGLDSERALELIRAAWGDERSGGKYIAVWQTEAGRELALQLEQKSARLWLESEPPADLGRGEHYASTEDRHTYLKANAPRLAQPKPAWLIVVQSEAQLSQILDWYGGLGAQALNQAELHRLMANFKQAMPGFETFDEPGATYIEHERAYKDELVELFRSEVQPLADQHTLSDDEAIALTSAVHRLLTQRLATMAGPQNLIGWQAVDRFKPNDNERARSIGRALAQLLNGAEPGGERLERFIDAAGEVFRSIGATGPLGIARLVGSCLLMLQNPDGFVVVRTDVFERAYALLRGAKFPTHNDEPGRVSAALALSDDLRQALHSAGWAPRDLIDVQSFLWVALMYDAANDERSIADLMSAFLKRFAEVSKGPLTTVPDLWATMGDLKARIEALPSVKARSDLIVDWSLGKGVWASVPWIAIMDQRITTSTQDGVYVVFLVSRDLSTIYLNLAQGTTNLVNELGRSEGFAALRARAEAFRAQVPSLADYGYALDGDVALGAEGWRAKSYEASVIAHRELQADALPSDAELNDMLEPLLAAYAAIAHNEDGPEALEEEDVVAAPVTIDDAMRGLFMERAEFKRILDVWRGKKNAILQGAPGVGKSFIARRLAYALMEERAPDRVEVVQFHQSYGYEDFIQGYRPTADGGFALRDGVFHRFCEAARENPERRYVFIIDEINRGNLSKIFGELMLLIEHDKRSHEWAAKLAYADESDPGFYVPENVWILGMMNTADRSLSMVDYALRRRFSFVTLRPGFNDPNFARHLADRQVSSGVVQAIVGGMNELNAAISEDVVNLGPGFQIGHSFFTPSDPVADGVAWFAQVVDTEIQPLLEEYWFDAPEKAADWCARLRSRA